MKVLYPRLSMDDTGHDVGFYRGPKDQDGLFHA
jgi:hypothetical protein